MTDTSSRAVVRWAGAAFALVLSGGLLAASTASAQTQPATAAAATGPATTPAAKPPPAYTVVRYDESYRFLAGQPDADLFDPLKYIPLGDDPDWYLSLGAQARYRYEYFDNNNFGAGPQDGDGFHLLRLFAHADAQLGENARAFLMLKSAQEWGREGGPRPPDEDEFDIDQAFLDLRVTDNEGPTVTLRGGRQYLQYGSQRLISPLDWPGSRRTFDGAKAMVGWNAEHGTDVLWARPVIVDKGPLNSSSDDVDLFGAYHTWKIAATRRLEPYLFYYDRNGPDAGNGPLTTSTEEQRWTAGARYAAGNGPLAYEVEADYQFGDVGDDGDISAWSVASEVSYLLANVSLKPKPFLGLDVASGDDDPTDGDLETHNQLYPLGHAYFGYIDQVGRQNIIDVHPGLFLALAKDVSFRGAYHMFWRQSDEDAVYNAGGGVTRADLGSDEKYIGSELDLTVNWQIDRHLSTLFGFSYFWAGDFIEDTGPDEDITFVYAQAMYTF